MTRARLLVGVAVLRLAMVVTWASGVLVAAGKAIGGVHLDEPGATVGGDAWIARDDDGRLYLWSWPAGRQSVPVAREMLEDLLREANRGAGVGS